MFHDAADPNTLFKPGDIILSKHADHGDQQFTWMVMVPLATIFKEADADGDGQVGRADAKAFFARTGVPGAILAQVRPASRPRSNARAHRTVAHATPRQAAAGDAAGDDATPVLRAHGVGVEESGHK
jgi:hypothetical protein